MDLFIWYEPGSYFQPHWSDWMKTHGFENLPLRPSYKSDNDRIISQLSKRSGGLNRLIMTVGGQPFSLPALRGLRASSSLVFVADDEWRFHETDRYLPFYFDWIATTYSPRLSEYAEHGVTSAFGSGYAANPQVFHKGGETKEIDVSIIGAAHPDRVSAARAILAAGFELQLFGMGWQLFPDLSPVWRGFLTTSAMVEVIGNTRIVVNTGLTISGVPQIKGRLFETAACGAFQLVTDIPHLTEYYEPGVELATFSSEEELISQLGHYLSNPNEREKIAAAGYRRTLAAHTWDARLSLLLQLMDEPAKPRPNAPDVLILNLRLQGAPAFEGSSDLDAIDSAWSGEDIRPLLVRNLDESRPVFVSFSEPGIEYDADYLRLLSFGLANDLESGIAVNLASFDFVDGAGRTYAYSLIDRLVRQSPGIVPISCYLVSADALLSINPETPLTAQNLSAEILPGFVREGRSSFIDLDTGLFRVEGAGDLGIEEIYGESADSQWRVRTKSYASQVTKSAALPSAFRLARALCARRRRRRAGHRPGEGRP